MVVGGSLLASRQAGKSAEAAADTSANDYDTEWVPSIHPFMLGGM